MADLDVFPEDWERALAVVAHPDDMEYGAAAAVARWTGQGKQIAYVLVSDGEAGISTMPPDEVGPLRREEQLASCRVVGVDDVEFLGWPDGSIVEGWRCGPTSPRRSAVTGPRWCCRSTSATPGAGRAGTTPTTGRSAGRCSTPCVTRRTRGCSPTGATPWDGVRFVAFSGSPQPTHGVDTTDTFDAGVALARRHRLYLDHLGGDMADPTSSSGAPPPPAANASAPPSPPPSRSSAENFGGLVEPGHVSAVVEDPHRRRRRVAVLGGICPGMRDLFR